MRLTLPEPSITLYDDGLEKHDKLDRQPLADRLSDLVENNDDPLVIALDGGWGSGKSLFLKCWVGEHRIAGYTDTTTLYFDAFENDYLEDPLIALTGALTDRLKKPGRAPKAVRNLKTAAFKIAPIAARLALAAATAGGTEAAGAIGGALINQSAKDVEKAADAYWQREDGRRAAMAEFRSALTALTEPDKGKPQKKLVIVIDELDRCRPDYALQLLEVIKHFFATLGVHFVLGVNMHELANSVRARYGAGIDADRYLHKFVRIRMPIKPPKEIDYEHCEVIEYFKKVALDLRISTESVTWTVNYLELVGYHFEITLRDMERLATLLVTTPSENIFDRAEQHIFFGLLILQIVRPTWINQARTSNLESEDFMKFFSLDGRHHETQFQEEAKWVWRATIDPQIDLPPEIKKKFDLGPTINDRPSRETLLTDIIANSLDAFELPN